MRTSCGYPVPRGCCTCRRRCGVLVGELERWLRGPVLSVAPWAPLGVRLPVGASGAPPLARVSRAQVVWARRPCSARSCEQSLRAVGLAGGCSRRAALRRCEGRLRSGARPLPAARPHGGLSGSATHVLWVGVCGGGGPAQSLWVACPVGGCAPRACWEVFPGGLAFRHCEGRLVSGAVSPPAARPSGRAARVPRPVFSGRGWCGRGDPAPVPQRALL